MTITVNLYCYQISTPLSLWKMYNCCDQITTRTNTHTKQQQQQQKAQTTERTKQNKTEQKSYLHGKFGV